MTTLPAAISAPGTAPSTQWIACDGNANVTLQTDAATGSVSGEWAYDPFGNVLTRRGAGTGANPFRFSTRYTDEETGLLYYGYRYLDPESGRWLNRDPIGERGGLNLYGLVGNDPVNQVDKLGLWKISRNSNHRRAVVTSEGCDTIEDLAKRVYLEPREYKKWLTGKFVPESIYNTIPSGTEFTIPNTAAVRQGDTSAPLDIFGVMDADVVVETLRFHVDMKKLGYHVENITGYSGISARATSESNDYAAVMLIGHGVKDGNGGYTGMFLDRDESLIGPQDLAVRLNFRLSLLVLVVCGCGDPRAMANPGIRGSPVYWNGLVSQYGSVYAHPGKIPVYENSLGGNYWGGGLLIYPRSDDPDKTDNLSPWKPRS